MLKLQTKARTALGEAGTNDEKIRSKRSDATECKN